MDSLNKDSLNKANTLFSLDLLRKLSENDNKKNVFYSPISISSALAMVCLGAHGDTAAQMVKALQLHRAKDVHTGFQSLTSEINKSCTKCLLRTASRLFGEKSYTFHTGFLDSCNKYYLSEPEQVDFQQEYEGARGQINNWVEEKTEDDSTSARQEAQQTAPDPVNIFDTEGEEADKQDDPEPVSYPAEEIDPNYDADV
ncbi:serpin-like protein HMSD [Lissotriton helveticus]